MKSTDKYKPISCVFYDLIEHYAVLREVVALAVKIDKETRVFNTRILDTKVVKKVEYILIETPKLTIRMDNIISINGEQLSDYNANC